MPLQNLHSKCLQNGKAWVMHLLSVACLSLAAKMEEIEVPLLLDLQVLLPFSHLYLKVIGLVFGY